MGVCLFLSLLCVALSATLSDSLGNLFAKFWGRCLIIAQGFLLVKFIANSLKDDLLEGCLRLSTKVIVALCSL